MLVAYSPENLQGAIEYIERKGIAAGDARAWIEQQTVERSDRAPENRDFVILYQGIGFFQDYPDETNAEMFGTETMNPGPDGADVLQVTYWIAAEPAAV